MFFEKMKNGGGFPLSQSYDCSFSKSGGMTQKEKTLKKCAALNN
ncbi:hypothetical protein D1BOALGB6SA_6607 [Olavius sp. associated proteobacterium Delta 1]|nr:hypothetical protein D1BOALGB6SA_6607 [Olavius sp. associated proteobacterium Delta 1]